MVLIQMKTGRRLIFLGTVVAILFLVLNNVTLVYEKANSISLPCEECFSEKTDEQARHISRHGKQLLKPTVKPTVSIISKEFVYLVQTEKCLPAKLLNEHHIGNAQRCRCDVMVLSFKQPCEDKNRTLFPHVQYLSRPTNTDRISWNTGRNLLYSTSKARNHNYLYYIFMDDDLELKYNEAHTPSSMRSVSPMRSFENFLLDYIPVIGVPNYLIHHNSDVMIKKIRAICKRGQFNSSSVFVPTIHFDASLNAFHKDAIKHILPYPTKYDQISWWHSQRYVIAVSELKFRGQSYLFMPLNSVNTNHGNYPQNDENANQVWSSIVQNLVSTIPPEYAREKWMKDFIEDPVKHTENSRAICWRFPRGFPIKPFAYFALKQEYKR